MALWAWFLIVAGILVAIEIFTGTFYLLMLALGLLIGSFVSFLTGNLAYALVVAALVAFVSTLLLKKRAKEKKDLSSTDPNIHIDIGNMLTIENWEMNETPIKARVSYRGTMWDAELKTGAKAKPGRFIIREIRANRLVVDNV